MAIVFFHALILIVALFTVKQWELMHERVLMPQWRARADVKALRVKELAFAARKDIEHLPPFLSMPLRASCMVSRSMQAILPSGSAGNRIVSPTMYRTKRNFERRETKSEFLKKVSKHKDGNDDGDEPTSTV